ncbi:carboxymuconolactone decarboxylase family protein [Streptacidiphilus sp. PB12-B1b]|uniref:carboxymuconolactone decarboxylase family protein n=1 Tax=Streptacidiphilus sp. PB12-B1b TaxID=2705012 RepID=UPI0015FDAA57|nr:carboxymuconolactone decarboxylase family protein [Streptacidiphilus sp. PB12-B1b]QMU75048.1 carboxymuconolactone decarboxylase family protein [Streptacidiphilus sp. PB12-B1b]
MSRIPLADSATLNDSQQAQYNRFPSNLTRAVLLLDDRLAGLLPESANALRATDLDPAWREAAILRVAALSYSAYERFQHLDQARAAGWSEQQISDIESGRFGRLDAEVAALLTFVDACVAGTDTTDETFGSARAVLTDRQLVNVIVLVGHYMTVARITGILRIELDDAPDAWTHDH